MAQINFIPWKPNTPGESISGTYQGTVATPFNTSMHVIKTSAGNYGIQGAMIESLAERFQQGCLVQINFTGWAEGKSHKYRHFSALTGEVVWSEVCRQHKKPTIVQG